MKIPLKQSRWHCHDLNVFHGKKLSSRKNKAWIWRWRTFTGI